ncbi:hypothetical protein PMAYCL1PPCAC_15040 [Pristionchus mayeri]|uniref:Membrane transporter n=1 Tax=Pristionchus mayeri TaxID=1317129 RepID=A0AAN5CI93_9BILA|nr:hypothetical protein PMAYCL1PPCAC_15040 [Pristionchus mayeri]
MGEWPYMSTIDHDATSTFYGYATAANKAGHAISAFAFAVWAHKISGIKIPVLAARLLSLVAAIMYFFVEFIPANRRWWMLACYVFFGVGFGTSPLLRSYIARVTSEENRSTAYALQNGALVMSVVVGPIAQIAFAGLPYPGAIIIPPNIKLNIITAPIWFALITNVIAIFVTVFCLEDTDKEEQKLTEESAHISIAWIKGRLGRLRALNLPWTLVILVLIEKMISGLFNATMMAIAGPMMSSMFALTGQQIVLIMAIAQVLVGLIALGLSVLFFVCKLGKRVSCLVLYAFSNILVIAGYVITFPYPFTSTPMKPFNETTRAGCNPLEYSWCDYQLVANIIPFTAILVIISGFALPSANMSLDTIYSKIVGKIDQVLQNVMQSLFVIADDIMSIAGPIFGS